MPARKTSMGRGLSLLLNRLDERKESMDGFEVITNARDTQIYDQPTLTIYNHKHAPALGISQLARKVLNTQWVTMLYNPTAHQLALRPESTHESGMYRLGNATGHISIQRLVRKYNLNVPAIVGPYTAVVQDGMLIVQLPATEGEE